MGEVDEISRLPKMCRLVGVGSDKPRWYLLYAWLPTIGKVLTLGILHLKC